MKAKFVDIDHIVLEAENNEERLLIKAFWLKSGKVEIVGVTKECGKEGYSHLNIKGEPKETG